MKKKFVLSFFISFVILIATLFFLIKSPKTKPYIHIIVGPELISLIKNVMSLGSYGKLERQHNFILDNFKSWSERGVDIKTSLHSLNFKQRNFPFFGSLASGGSNTYLEKDWYL